MSFHSKVIVGRVHFITCAAFQRLSADVKTQRSDTEDENERQDGGCREATKP